MDRAVAIERGENPPPLPPDPSRKHKPEKKGRKSVIKQKLTTKEISIFGNSSHLEWRAVLSDTILKRDHPRTIPVKFALIWFSGFRGEDLNVIFYQNMTHNLA
jgi:hypothetical protein